MNEQPPRFHSSSLQALAQVISAVTSPFIVTAVTVTCAVILLRPPVGELLLWAAISVVFAAAIPLLVVHRLWRQGRVTDLHVAIRRQRRRPFAAALLSGSAGVVILYLVQAPAPLVALGAVYIVIGTMLALISLRWKISVHTAVLTAGIISIALIGYRPVWMALMLVPLVLWARVYRQRHTLLQGLVPVLLAGVTTPLVYDVTVFLMSGPSGRYPLP